MYTYPRVLHVNTSFAPPHDYQTEIWDATLDYRVYENAPYPWRLLERLLRLDIFLAFKARQLSSQYDLILAGSERVGIPLSLLRLKRPLVTVIHHVASASKQALLHATRAYTAWRRIGYLSTADRDFFQAAFRVEPARFFRHLAAPLLEFQPTRRPVRAGPVMSVGVSKRDYQTLISAVAQLPGYETTIYASSRYGDSYRADLSQCPDWVRIEPEVSQSELAYQYAQARFALVPLLDSTQYSVGVSAVLEACSAGKAVIATKTKGMPDYVLDGVTGLLVPPGDIDALRDAIHTLWNNPALAHRMGIAARRFVEENFHPDVVTSATRQTITAAYREAG